MITTIHNQPAMLARLAASISAQTLKPAQWIIVDNGSDEALARQLQATLATARGENNAGANLAENLAGVNIELIRQNTRSSLACARNAAMARVRSERISLLEPGISYAPGFLERMQLLAKKYLPDMLILAYSLPGAAEPEPRQSTIKQLATPLEPKLYLLRDPLALLGTQDFQIRLGSNICYRREFLQTLRYDETLDCFEDIDLWYRALRAGMARGPVRCMVESGNYLGLSRRPDAVLTPPLSRIEAATPPELLLHLSSSEDAHDRLLGELLLRRWLPGSFRHIRSVGGRMRFLWRHRLLLRRFIGLRRRLAPRPD